MESTIMVSSLLFNILIGCICIVIVSWAVVGIETAINDLRQEKREEEQAQRNLEYHEKRMKSSDD